MLTERKIKNFETLAATDLRRAALTIAEAGFRAINTESRVKAEVVLRGENLRIRDWSVDLKDVGRIFVVGIGKCSTEAGAALEEILGERIAGGVIIDVKQGAILKRITAYKGSHPLPSNENIKAATSIVGLLRGLEERDLVIFIVSGGGSTLLCLPQDRGCEEEASVLYALMDAGATIQEINTVRKHLSLARGGYLAEYAYPAQVVSLIFSDVPGNDIQYVSSGPTVKDLTTIEDAEEILAKYNILMVCGIEKCGLIETPKDDKYFAKVKNIMIVSNELALASMREKAQELGFTPAVRSAAITGETREVAQRVVEELHAAPPKSALLYGGETTVTVKGKGKGGRNLEFALSALRLMQSGEVVMAVASDGRDNSDFAGAICDTITKEKAATKNLDLETYLNENNEYPFFEAIGDYLMTGDTGSNVSDLVIALKQ